MPAAALSVADLFAWIDGRPTALDVGAGGASPVVVVDLDQHDSSAAPALHTGVPAIVVGQTTQADPHLHAAASACDVVLHAGDEALSAIVAAADHHPIAATALAMVLRGSEGRPIDDGLLVESAVYSALQAGPEFAAWRAGHPRHDRGVEGDPVLLERAGSALQITLNRPAVRNALNTAMRDALVDAFELPAADPTIVEVHLRGTGDAFCSGGDLDEFGTFVDPASAHLVRLERSVGRSIAAVSSRVIAHLQGACVGSGIELPAFARRVFAHPDAVIALPELSLGLIPGAGGTVSLPRRIGRLRTARLALTGERIDAPTALAWGLVDAIDEAG